MLKKLLLSYLLVFSCLLQVNGLNVEAQENLTEKPFEEIIAEAKGTKVSFYGWGGDELRNNWLNSYYKDRLKEKYDIDFEYIGMDIEEILSKLANENQANKSQGSIDMIWINGENFQSAQSQSLLFGPFLESLPNYQAFYDPEDPENNYDFAYPIEGFEAPYGRAQLVFIKDAEKHPETINNTQDLLEFAKKYPGQVTYPALPDFTGSAFVRNIIYEFVDYEELMDSEMDKETLKEKIEPALSYLRDLNPYLWQEGQTYPSSSTELNNMFMDGELALYQTYGPFEIAASIMQGSYPETAESFVFEDGTIGNTNYIAIAANAPNKAGALVAINEMLHWETMASLFQEVKIIPPVSMNHLPEEGKEVYENLDAGPGTLDQDTLMDKRKPEMPAQLVPMIEEIWEEEVAGQTN